MLLTISITRNPVTNLGYLFQEFGASTDRRIVLRKAHVFYPEAPSVSVTATNFKILADTFYKQDKPVDFVNRKILFNSAESERRRSRWRYQLLRSARSQIVTRP